MLTKQTAYYLSPRSYTYNSILSLLNTYIGVTVLSFSIQVPGCREQGTLLHIISYDICILVFAGRLGLVPINVLGIYFSLFCIFNINMHINYIFYAALRSKSKDWLVQNRDNVPERNNVSTQKIIVSVS
jgi:hypothetical protein